MFKWQLLNTHAKHSWEDTSSLSRKLLHARTHTHTHVITNNMKSDFSKNIRQKEIWEKLTDDTCVRPACHAVY